MLGTENQAGDAMRDYLASSMRAINSRQSQSIDLERARRRAVAAADSERAAEEDALRRKVRAEWRASLTLAERILDTLRDLRWLGLAWLLVSVPVAVAALGLGLAAGSAPLAAGAGLYLIAVAAGAGAARRRERRLPPEHVDRVREQLGRVQAVLEDA